MKALALLSGGLDSALAIKLIKDQGIDVVALNFVSPFYLCNQKGRYTAIDVAKNLKVPLKIMDKGEEYLHLIRKPKYGYGKNLNPCIDCRIFIFKKAKEYAKKIGAKFIFTGEVLDERPMSQHRKALEIIEKEAGLKGRLLRPLSAKLLPETEAEKKSWIDRNKLLAIRGRSRKPQFELVRKFKLKGYASPGGGCLLTFKEFADKLRDLFKHKEKITRNDIILLKTGRHFRFDKNKIIVGRNEGENKQLLKLKQKSDIVFEVKGYMGPITLLQGPKTKKAIELAAKLTARYSDADRDKVLVKYVNEKLDKEVVVNQIRDKETEQLRIKNG